MFRTILRWAYFKQAQAKIMLTRGYCASEVPGSAENVAP